MSVPTHAHPLALDMLLAESAALHRHLCPRQVIGVRMGLLAARLLDLALPQEDTGCWVGRRTLRVVDYGKVAATVIDTQGERAWRIAPHPDARAGAATYAPAARNNWQAMLDGYQQMPDDELFTWQAVTLTQSLAEILSKPGCRAVCARCGEEILNERELLVGGEILCRACAEGGYWRAG